MRFDLLKDRMVVSLLTEEKQRLSFMIRQNGFTIEIQYDNLIEITVSGIVAVSCLGIKIILAWYYKWYTS